MHDDAGRAFDCSFTTLRHLTQLVRAGTASYTQYERLCASKHGADGRTAYAVDV